MNGTQKFVLAIAAFAAGIGLTVYGCLIGNEAVRTVGISLITGVAGWIGLARPQDS